MNDWMRKKRKQRKRHDWMRKKRKQRKRHGGRNTGNVTKTSICRGGGDWGYAIHNWQERQCVYEKTIHANWKSFNIGKRDKSTENKDWNPRKVKRGNSGSQISWVCQLIDRNSLEYQIEMLILLFCLLQNSAEWQKRKLDLESKSEFSLKHDCYAQHISLCTIHISLGIRAFKRGVLGVCKLLLSVGLPSLYL